MYFFSSFFSYPVFIEVSTSHVSLWHFPGNSEEDIQVQCYSFGMTRLIFSSQRFKRLQTGSSMWCAAVSPLSEEPAALVKTGSWRMKLVGCFYSHTCKTLTVLGITGFPCVVNLFASLFKRFPHFFLSLRREQHLYLVWFRNSVFFLEAREPLQPTDLHPALNKEHSGYVKISALLWNPVVGHHTHKQIPDFLHNHL